MNELFDVKAEGRRVRRFIEMHGRRLGQNLGRVRNLIEMYEALHGRGRGKRRVQDADILRAAVVLLHASLEDFIRSISAVQLPIASAEALNGIPLVGSASNRPEKFLLGRLVAFRGLTVDEVISRSVKQHLEYSNYNNIRELASVLSGLGVHLAKVEGFFPDLEAMMQRRHRIVHRADRVESPGRGRQHAEELSPRTVEKWVGAVHDFAVHTMGAISLQRIEGWISTARNSFSDGSVPPLSGT